MTKETLFKTLDQVANGYCPLRVEFVISDSLTKHDSARCLKTKNILHVKEMLGHRKINSTLVYTHLVPFDDDAEVFYHATAKDDKEAGELYDQGFRYDCTTPQGIMLFIKKKK